MKKLLIIVLMALCSTPCFANTGNDLLNWCENKDNLDFFEGICVGYINGVSNVYTELGVVCAKGTTRRQELKVVMKYLRNNPELLHHWAYDLVRDALKKAFPCK